ncbi:MAG TPA: glycosyltransferase [Chitinophagaceae bacterium]|jgi:glycosyltransferase involved in cell wall biosynthesis
MIRALWLTSWYPNKLDAVNGDFIQRHARATALFCKVDVIHLEPDKNNILTNQVDISTETNGNLSETIVLYKLNNTFLAGRLFSFNRYLLLFKKQIRQYISLYGKPDIVHVHIPIKAGIVAYWLKRTYGVPYVVTEHWAIYNNEAEDAYPRRNFFFKYYTKKILVHAAAFLPVSSQLGKAVQKMVSVIPYTPVPNVADTNFFNDVCTKEDSDVFRFVHVSTLKYQKNPEGILRVYAKFCAQHPFTELVIAGEASVPLAQSARALGIPDTNILFKGFISYEQVAEVLKLSNVMIMFSRFENLPCVVIEALCCGVPVISTDIGGIPEIIDTSNGVLVNNEDEDALYKAMEQLYSRYHSYDRKVIAKNAQEKFSYATVGRQIKEVYSQIIAIDSETQVR